MARRSSWIAAIMIAAPLCASTVPRAGAADAAGTADATAPAAPADSVEVRRQVDAGNAAFVKAWLTGDAGLFASCFAEDGATLQPGGRLVHGREKIHERMKGVYSRVRMTEGTITTVDLFILGDTAYETGKWKFAIGPIGALAEPDSGHFVEVWKRTAKGEWKMWRDIGVPR